MTEPTAEDEMTRNCLFLIIAVAGFGLGLLAAAAWLVYKILGSF